MIRTDDFAKVAKKTSLTTEQVAEVLKATQEFVQEKVKTEAKYTLPGFGFFQQVKKEARVARNPATGESVELPERTEIQFKISESLKKVLQD